jgi:hypothetical protein
MILAIAGILEIVYGIILICEHEPLGVIITWSGVIMTLADVAIKQCEKPGQTWVDSTRNDCVKVNEPSEQAR